MGMTYGAHFFAQSTHTSMQVHRYVSTCCTLPITITAFGYVKLDCLACGRASMRIGEGRFKIVQPNEHVQTKLASPQNTLV